MYDYDVTVIGGGPGGYTAAIQAARAGKKTCLVEAGQLGGTCLNVGCIPTKVMVGCAGLLWEIRRAEKFGITGINKDKVGVDLPRLLERKRAVTSRLTQGVAALLHGNGVTVVKGKASLRDGHTVMVEEGRKIRSEYIIVAAGSESVSLPIPCEEGCRVLTSTQALELTALPASLAVLGGGVVGVEFAYIFSRLGCKVTVLELTDRILPMVDEEISRLAQHSLERAGVVFHLGTRVTELKRGKILFQQNGRQGQVESEAVLMAAGRRPNTEGLGVQEAGLELERNAIRCDRAMRTNIPSILAVGDVNGKSMLAHTAFHEARQAVDTICGHAGHMSYERIPSCIYINPEIACVGLTEAQAKERYGDRVKVGRFPIPANGKSLVEGNEEGLFKVIVDSRYGEILGAHLMGGHVTEMIGEVCAAMEAEATAEELIQTVHPHPTISEGLGEAVCAAWQGWTVHNL